MFNRHPGARASGSRWGLSLGAWALIVLFQFACATGSPRSTSTAGDHPRSLPPPATPQERLVPSAEHGFATVTEYELGFLEPGAAATQPVPIHPVDFQHALQKLTRDIRLGVRTPREAARELLELAPPVQGVETVESQGDWLLETYAGQGYTLVPERQQGPVVLTPVADEALKTKYLGWCEHRGGGDCLGLLDDGPYLRTDDLAASQWDAQGGAATLGQAEATEAAFATEGALARAVAAVEAVATSPQGPLAVVMSRRAEAAATTGWRGCWNERPEGASCSKG